ncbi:MAG: multicopper oxidase domain-containing protein [Gammaproteobacteria bacterium]
MSKHQKPEQNAGPHDHEQSSGHPTAPLIAGISRRDFLRRAAVMTGGTAIAGTSLAANAASPMPHQSTHQGAGSGAHMGHQMDGYSSMMFMEGHSMKPGQIIEPPGSPSPDEVQYKVFDIDVRIVEHEILPGIKTHLFGFNGQVPGPEFHVNEGDWVQVNFTNRTEEMHTIHWHGVVLPYTMDGVPMVTQDPVHPGDTFVYRFQAKPSGTRWYHCHWSTPLHATSAMHGAFIIHPNNDPIQQKYPYTREYVMMLEAWDIDFIREEMNGLLEGMKQVNRLMAQGKLDYKTHGFFKNYQEFKQAVESGEYIAPYLQSRSSGVEVKPNFFAINGKSYPATKRIGIKQGEWIRIRLINASGLSHHMHLHGHDFYWVAQDGNELAEHRRLNTIHVEPGGTYDIVVHGDNPGFWTFHDHNTTQTRNNGIYPGGMLTVLAYEDFEPTYVPSVSVDQ